MGVEIAHGIAFLEVVAEQRAPGSAATAAMSSTLTALNPLVANSSRATSAISAWVVVGRRPARRPPPPVGFHHLTPSFFGT